MLFKNFIIYIFVIGLLSSNVTWAGNGMVDNMLDSMTQAPLIQTQTTIDLSSKSDSLNFYGQFPSEHNNLMHHLVDKHHDDHDCHMAAHLIGLNSNVITITHHSVAQDYASLEVLFSTFLISPPNKPPRA